MFRPCSGPAICPAAMTRAGHEELFFKVWILSSVDFLWFNFAEMCFGPFQCIKAGPEVFRPCLDLVLCLAAFTRAGHDSFIYWSLESISVFIFPQIWCVLFSIKVFWSITRYLGWTWMSFFITVWPLSLSVCYISSELLWSVPSCLGWFQGVLVLSGAVFTCPGGILPFRSVRHQLFGCWGLYSIPGYMLHQFHIVLVSSILTW